MVAIDVRDGEHFNPDELFSWLKSQLPIAAMPRFVRLVDSLDTTGSFKFLKHTLQSDGFEPDAETESGRFWVWDPKKKTYKKYSPKSRNAVFKIL